MLMTKCFSSCSIISFGNQPEVKRMLKSFSREYTGLDTLIKMDGYYYYEYYDVDRNNNTELRITSFVFSGNGEFNRYGFFRTHESLQRNITTLKSYNGFYTVVDDTIKTKWVEKFQIGMYILFEEYFLIENNTALRQIRRSSTRPSDGRKFETETNNVYHFLKYSTEIK